MAKDYIYDLREVLKCCDDKDTKLKFYNYVIDEKGTDNYYDYIERAEIYDEMHKYRHALRDYGEAITHATWNRHTSYAFNKMSEMYYKLREYDKAIEYSQMSISSNESGFIHIDYEPGALPDIPSEYSMDMAIQDSAELMYKLGKYDKALSLMKSGKIECFLTSDAILLSKILIAKKDYKKAISVIDKQVEDKIDQLMLKAEIEKLQNNMDKALEYYKEAEKREELGWEYHIDHVYKALGEYYESKNDFKKAFEYYDKIRDYSRNCIPIGDLCYKLMQYKDALVYYFEQLSDEWKINNNKAELYYKIGLTKKALGQKDAARYFMLAHNADESNEDYKKVYDETKEKDDDRKERLLNLRFWDEDRVREIRYIIRNILDDWLEKEEIDDTANEYIKQLIPCKYANEKVGNKYAGDLIFEFLKCIDKKYTGKRAEELKEELRNTIGNNEYAVNEEPFAEIQQQNEETDSDYEEFIEQNENETEEWQNDYEEYENEKQSGFEDGYKYGYQKGLEIMNTSCNAHVDDYNPYEDEYYKEEKDELEQVENSSDAYQEGYAEGYERGFAQGKNDADGQKNYFEDIPS